MNCLTSFSFNHSNAQTFLFDLGDIYSSNQKEIMFSKDKIIDEIKIGIGIFSNRLNKESDSPIYLPTYSIDIKLKSLIVGSGDVSVVRNEIDKTITVPTYIATIFEREMEQNVLESNREKYGYIELKQEEIWKLNYTTHPVEYDMYYSV